MPSNAGSGGGSSPVAGSGIAVVGSTVSLAIHSISAVAAGTAPTLNQTANTALAFGTTSPSITLDQAGTYLILASVTIAISSDYTQAADNYAQFFMRRTNNGAANLGGQSSIRIGAFISDGGANNASACWFTPYTTAATNDIVVVTGKTIDVPSAGGVTALATSTAILAIRIA